MLFLATPKNKPLPIAKKTLEQVHVWTGTSGLVLPVPNKSHFPEQYQDKSRLHYYSTLFNSIEINSTFYKVPQQKTMARWESEVTDHFRFTVKLWKGITHNKALAFSSSDLRHFMDTIEPLGPKKGCLLVQFPGKVDIDHFTAIKKLLSCLQKLNARYQWPVQLEFRNSSLYCSKMESLLHDLHFGAVLHDMHQVVSLSEFASSNVLYLRLHGPEKGYRGDYSRQTLLSYARRIRSWSAGQREVFVYFNNTLGNAVQNLMSLNQILLSPRSKS